MKIEKILLKNGSFLLRGEQPSVWISSHKLVYYFFFSLFVLKIILNFFLFPEKKRTRWGDDVESEKCCLCLLLFFNSNSKILLCRPSCSRHKVSGNGILWAEALEYPEGLFWFRKMWKIKNWPFGFLGNVHRRGKLVLFLFTEHPSMQTENGWKRMWKPAQNPANQKPTKKRIRNQMMLQMIDPPSPPAPPLPLPAIFLWSSNDPAINKTTKYLNQNTTRDPTTDIPTVFDTVVAPPCSAALQTAQKTIFDNILFRYGILSLSVCRVCRSRAL